VLELVVFVLFFYFETPKTNQTSCLSTGGGGSRQRSAFIGQGASVPNASLSAKMAGSVITEHLNFFIF
jgi:hypothetical protein